MSMGAATSGSKAGLFSLAFTATCTYLPFSRLLSSILFLSSLLGTILTSSVIFHSSLRRRPISILLVRSTGFITRESAVGLSLFCTQYSRNLTWGIALQDSSWKRRIGFSNKLETPIAVSPELSSQLSSKE